MAAGDKIVNAGINLMQSRCFADSKSHISRGRIGIGTTTPAAGDTAMEFEVPVSPDLVQACDDHTDWTESAQAIAAADNTTDYKEGGTETDDTAQSLGKSGTGASSITYDASIASTNLSGEDFFVWVYVKDATALAKLKAEASGGCRVYLSHNAFTNYDYWNVGGNDTFSVGWNLVKLDCDTPDGDDGVGATITAITDIRLYFDCNNASDTLSSGDLLMDYWHRATPTTDYVVSFDSATFDTEAKKVEAQLTLDVTQGNGYLISEYDTENTESTPDMFGHHVETGDSKSRTEEWRITFEYQGSEA